MYPNTIVFVGFILCLFMFYNLLNMVVTAQDKCLYCYKPVSYIICTDTHIFTIVYSVNRIYLLFMQMFYSAFKEL